MSTRQRPIEAAAPGELHDETQIGLLEADTLQRYDVGVIEEPEEPRFGVNTLDGQTVLLVRCRPHEFDGDLKSRECVKITYTCKRSFLTVGKIVRTEFLQEA
jgi:hypothetical protein